MWRGACRRRPGPTRSSTAASSVPSCWCRRWSTTTATASPARQRGALLPHRHGGMFTVLKVRADPRRAHPRRWYQHPAWTSPAPPTSPAPAGFSCRPSASCDGPPHSWTSTSWSWASSPRHPPRRRHASSARRHAKQEGGSRWLPDTRRTSSLRRRRRSSRSHWTLWWAVECKPRRSPFVCGCSVARSTRRRPDPW
jgi:hypothetical protein